MYIIHFNSTVWEVNTYWEKMFWKTVLQSPKWFELLEIKKVISILRRSSDTRSQCYTFPIRDVTIN